MRMQSSPAPMHSALTCSGQQRQTFTDTLTILAVRLHSYTKHAFTHAHTCMRLPSSRDNPRITPTHPITPAPSLLSHCLALQHQLTEVGCPRCCNTAQNPYSCLRTPPWSQGPTCTLPSGPDWRWWRDEGGTPHTYRCTSSRPVGPQPQLPVSALPGVQAWLFLPLGPLFLHL